MKKLLVCLLAVILAFGMTVSVAAVASPEVNGIISGVTATDKADKPVEVDFTKIDGKVTEVFQDGLKDLKKESGDSSLKVVAQYNVEIAGTSEYPLSIALDVLGISNTSKVYALVKVGNSVKALEATVANGKLTFAIDAAISSLAIVTDKATAANVEKENDVLSPQTGDATLAVAAFAVVMAAAAGFAFKKVRA